MRADYTGLQKEIEVIVRVTFIEHLICAKYCIKCFTGTIFFNHHNNLMRWKLHCHFTEKELQANSKATI